MIFLGDAGSLNENYNAGDIVTPTYAICGTFANAYLEEDILEYKMFEKVQPNHWNFIEKVISLADKENIKIKKGSVFSTDSMACEYYHFNTIKSFHADLIEMETSSFYKVANLMDKPAMALLVVTENYAKNELLGIGSDLSKALKINIINDLLFKIANLF